MEFQNGRILNEMCHFYRFWGPFGPHHGLLRVNAPIALHGFKGEAKRTITKYLFSSYLKRFVGKDLFQVGQEVASDEAGSWGQLLRFLVIFKN